MLPFIKMFLKLFLLLLLLLKICFLKLPVGLPPTRWQYFKDKRIFIQLWKSIFWFFCCQDHGQTFKKHCSSVILCVLENLKLFAWGRRAAAFFLFFGFIERDLHLFSGVVCYCNSVLAGSPLKKRISVVMNSAWRPRSLPQKIGPAASLTADALIKG